MIARPWSSSFVLWTVVVFTTTLERGNVVEASWLFGEEDAVRPVVDDDMRPVVYEHTTVVLPSSVSASTSSAPHTRIVYDDLDLPDSPRLIEDATVLVAVDSGNPLLTTGQMFGTGQQWSGAAKDGGCATMTAGGTTYSLAEKQALTNKLTLFLKAYFADIRTSDSDVERQGPPWALHIVLPTTYREYVWDTSK